MPSSSKRPFELSKQPNNGKRRDNRSQTQTPQIGSLQTRVDIPQRDDDSQRRSKYSERAQTIHPVKISRSPSSVFRYPTSNLPPGTTYNANKSPVTSALSSAANGYPSDRAKSISNFGYGRSTALSPSSVSPPVALQSTSQNSPNHVNLSTSPPAPVGGRPLSHPNSHPKSLASFAGRSPPASMHGANRRASMYSNYGHQPLAGQVPLPHEEQPHFYGAPQIDFGAPARTTGIGNTKDSERGQFLGFDTLDGSGDAASIGIENVILYGREGGLDVYKVQHEDVHLIGALDGLKGSVLGAKLLPWNNREDPAASLRPLVAIVLHGPIISGSNAGNQIGATEDAITDSPPMSAHLSCDEEEALSKITHYQTTVEVYSMATYQLISTLFTSPPVPVSETYTDGLPEVPAPACDIVLEAKGNFVVVALGGRYGEIFVYSLVHEALTERNEIFKCIGKLWTTLQPRQQTASTIHGTSTFPLDPDPTARAAPLFSLCDRWLAVVPPPSSSQFSLYGTPLGKEADSHVPGMNVQMSPSPPAVNCAVDAPESRFMDRMSREAAKNFVKGAQWLGDQGKQWWKYYATRESTTAPQNGYMQPTAPVSNYFQETHFPPTHAAHNAQANAEPTLVAVYDLNRLLKTAGKRAKNVLAPIAVFDQALGCSFLSFSPSGLHLLTASKKGDTQILWDFKRLCHGRGASVSSRGNSILGPHVRELTRYNRVTDATIIDVIWAPPKDEKLAVLTEKGTLHVHSVSPAVFQWPPPRRIINPSAQASSTQHTPRSAGSPDQSSPWQRSRLNSAVDAVSGTANSWFSTIRSRSLSNGANVPSLSGLSITPAVGAGAKGAKAVATSTGKTIGDGVSYVRHQQDNKIHLLHQNQIAKGASVNPRCARWLTGNNRGLIVTVVDQDLTFYKVSTVVRGAKRGSKGMRSVVVKAAYRSQLPLLPSPRIAPAVMQALLPPTRSSEYANISANRDDSEPQGYWQPRSPTSPCGFNSRDGRKDRVMWKSYAELATTCDYQKFHTDPRVSLFVYDSAGDSNSAILASAMQSQHEQEGHQPQQGEGYHHVSDDSPWVFGLDIPHKQISSGAAAAASAGVIAGEDGAADLVWSAQNEGLSRQLGAEDDFDVIDFAEDRV